MRYPAILAAALVLTWAGAAQADTIRTSGGIGVNGTIVDMDAENLIVQVEAAKRSIPLAEVSRIECEKIPDEAPEGTEAEVRPQSGEAAPRREAEAAAATAAAATS